MPHRVSPQWISEEVKKGVAIATEISACSLPRRRAPLASRLELKVSDALALVEGLGGTTRALPVRQLLRALGFDEHRLLEWRLEHKLVQGLVLRHWIPEAVPVTCGLGKLARGREPEELRRFLDETFPGGYVLKAALGDSSGESPERDNPEAARRILQAAVRIEARDIVDERYVVQERIAIATEYRVHSLEEAVIEDLTFRRYEAGSIVDERERPNAFVRDVLRRLPDAVVGGSLLAWDIALQPSGAFAIIEVNFSGFHPAFKRGFHCSGYFHDQHWGACDTARLLNHVAGQDGVEVAAEPDVPERPLENEFYRNVAVWQRRHRGEAAPIPARHFDGRTERELACPLIRQIDSFAGPRRRGPMDAEIELRLSAAIPLLAGLAATTRALLLRQVLGVFGFDEKRLSCWRLEHKLIQAHVFRHYFARSLPETLGLDRLTQSVPPRELRKLLRETFPEGFVIKTALGDCSGHEIDQRTEAALAWMEGGGRYMPGAGTLADEEFIVQSRKYIQREYRVHTIEDRVIEDLTVHRHRGTVAPGEREGPNGYVQQILDALPAGITAGAHLGWDVAMLGDGSFTTIEVNIGGLHTVYNPGFHASGFFHHKDYGAIYSARLLLFLEKTYQCRITVIADAPEYFDECHFYSEVADWKSRF